MEKEKKSCIPCCRKKGTRSKKVDENAVKALGLIPWTRTTATSENNLHWVLVAKMSRKTISQFVALPVDLITESVAEFEMSKPPSLMKFALGRAIYGCKREFSLLALGQATYVLKNGAMPPKEGKDRNNLLSSSPKRTPMRLGNCPALRRCTCRQQLKAKISIAGKRVIEDVWSENCAMSSKAFIRAPKTPSWVLTERRGLEQTCTYTLFTMVFVWVL